MRNVLVLGANGFIGQCLSKKLADLSDVNLTLFSRKFSSETEKLKENKNVSLVKGDLEDLLELVPVINGQDIVYHLISASVPSTSWEYPNIEIEKNLVPSINLFKLCSDLKVKKIVYVSSGGTIYGKQQGILTEESLIQPFSPYGIIKAGIEHFLEYFKIKSGLNSDIYRVSNVYGPGLNKRGFGVINTWLRAVQDNQTLKIYGNAAKDYIYVDDVAVILTRSLELPEDTSHTFNVSMGKSYSLKEIMSFIKKITQSNPDVEVKNNMDSDNQFIELDNSKLMKQFPDLKLTSVEEGIRKIWEYNNE